MLDPVFKPSVNFRTMVDHLATRKVAFNPQALQYGFIQELTAEVRCGPFERLRSEGKVREDYDKYKLGGRDRFTPKLAQLANFLAWGIRLGCDRRTEQFLDWNPNDIEVHRYRPGNLAITSHRDYQSNLRFVALVTLEGFASFYHHRGGRNCDPKRYDTGPGSLALVDISQFHAADPPVTGERLVVVMWMKADRTLRSAGFD